MKPLYPDEEEDEHTNIRQNELMLSECDTQSIQQFSGALEQGNTDGEDQEEARRSEGVFLTNMDEVGRSDWSPKTQSEAVNQLKSLLLKHSKEVSPPFSSPKKHSAVKRLQKEQKSNVSANQDFVPIAHDQSEYIQHLEAEVKFCKEELEGLKRRIRVVVVENEKLHSELKSKQESFQDYMIQNSLVSEDFPANNHSANSKGIALREGTQNYIWKQEMEQLRVIHKSQIESLEAQIVSLRKELSVSQRECEEVKVLRHREKQTADALRAGGGPRVSGLCIKCAQHDAVMAGSHANLHMQTIERITKERNELLMTLNTVRKSHQEAQQREWAACLQVKQAVEIVEEANVQKAKVQMQFEQLSRELSRLRDRLQQEAKTMVQKLAAARDDGLTEGRKQKEELADIVARLSQRVADLESQLDRAHRDKSSLTKELEETLRRLTTLEQENTKVCVDLQYQLSHAQLQKEEAERELRELSSKSSRQKEKAAQEVERLNLELVGCRQHLEAVQTDGSQWQTEALSLAEQLANAQRQLHLTRQEREAAEQAHEDKMTSATLAWRSREKDLTLLLQQAESQHQKKAAEMDVLLSSQNSLLSRMKDQCCMLGATLEELAEKNRSELEHQALERRHLEDTVKSLRARCVEMEEQCVQHGRMHQCMKDRLLQLDRHCQNSAQQVCELLTKQNQLMQERNTLSEETQVLRGQLSNSKQVTQSS
ncbi:serologically defined colon cancer antigen 8 homolog isoform X2 [Synchiropus splendidus]|uniref:serologically defined colon cancer antigen 8 homolog isoform X2 n=1 Tax=Synchiropus splendidus TaxID=270530 RepID=UPI00237E5325|nr:serologically defined colon cancer antigen 8 homolog isoform X2 [Synchiropus splendidus]